MKRSILFAIALTGCGHAWAQGQTNPPDVQPPASIEEVSKVVGQFVMQASFAKQKADYAAIAAHCTRLDSRYAAGFSARRPELESQWLAIQQKQAAVIGMMGMMMSSRGGNISMSDVMNGVYRAMTPPPVSTLPKEKNRPGRIPKETPATAEPAPAPALPEVPVSIQENANQKAMEEVKSRMESLTWEQQRGLCEAGLAYGALPKMPEKEAAPAKEPQQGM